MGDQTILEPFTSIEHASSANVTIQEKDDSHWQVSSNDPIRLVLSGSKITITGKHDNPTGVRFCAGNILSNSSIGANTFVGSNSFVYFINGTMFVNGRPVSEPILPPLETKTDVDANGEVTYSTKWFICKSLVKEISSILDGNFDIPNFFDHDKAKIMVKGKGSIHVEGMNSGIKHLELKLAGKGDIHFESTNIAIAKLQLSGTGDMSVENCQIKHMVVTLSGTGDISLPDTTVLPWKWICPEQDIAMDFMYLIPWKQIFQEQEISKGKHPLHVIVLDIKQEQDTFE